MGCICTVSHIQLWQFCHHNSGSTAYIQIHRWQSRYSIAKYSIQIRSLICIIMFLNLSTIHTALELWLFGSHCLHIYLCHLLHEYIRATCPHTGQSRMPVLKLLRGWHEGPGHGRPVTDQWNQEALVDLDFTMTKMAALLQKLMLVRAMNSWTWRIHSDLFPFWFSDK